MFISCFPFFNNALREKYATRGYLKKQLLQLFLKAPLSPVNIRVQVYTYSADSPLVKKDNSSYTSCSVIIRRKKRREKI